jgi:hypothetical protein
VAKMVERAAEQVATTIDRRRFLRRAAQGTFYTVAVITAGGGLDVLRAATAWAYTSSCAGAGNVGAGCPSGGHYGNPCGPSRCCSHLGTRPAGCNCESSGHGCKSGTTRCKGKDDTWGGTACWTCNGPSYKSGDCYFRRQTTCCDCKTSGCSDSSGHCISWSSITQKIGC